MALPKAKEIISSNSVVVFSKTSCPFCVKVKKLLTDLGASYKTIELDTESDGSDVQAALAQLSGQRTVPNVFISGKHIGGCDDTTALHNGGKLVPLLTEAGAIAKTSQMALPKAKEIISSNSVVVFSKTYCPFCVEVKKLLTDLGASYKAIELDTESDGSDIQAALAQLSGQRTVPNVFISGKHIGGCDDTTALHNSGKLVPLLTEAGAIAKTSA